MHFNPEDYQTLFRLDVAKGRVTGILSQFIMLGSLNVGNPIITFDGQWWTLRLHKASEEAVGRKGLELFQDEAKYTAYAEEFRNYLSTAEEKIVVRFKEVPTDISQAEFLNLIEELKKFWYYYGITESVYHDMAHQVMLETKNAVMEKNLADLEKLKFEGRALLNVFILESGTLDNLLKAIANKFIKGDPLIKYFYIADLEKLFAGQTVELEKIAQRKNSFVIAVNDGIITYLEDDDAASTAQAFTDFEQAEFKKAASGLKGQTAFGGKVTGMVVISPMLDMKAAHEVEKRMKKGDILVVQSTNPDLMALCHKAGAIVTDQGGMLSHAAIISRELQIPCVVGTTNGTKVFKDGDYVEVDADNGIIKVIDKPS